MNYTARLAAALSGGAVLAATLAVSPGHSSAATTDTRPSSGKISMRSLSAGGLAWFNGPQTPGTGAASPAVTHPIFGTNVDANDPSGDLAAGQSETAIAASGSTVVTAWNDSSGFFVAPATARRASLTGIGLSLDGGRSFRDLTGLRNDNSNQQWFGDPTIAAIDAHHFAIGSLYLSSLHSDCTTRPARLQLAVEILTVAANGTPSLGLPVVTADGGDLCPLFNNDPKDDPPNLAFLDKEWLSYDPASRQLNMSFTRFFFGIAGQSGAGQIELVRAHVPANPATLSRPAWGTPVRVWPEEATVVNTGAYVSTAPGGDAYVSWERNYYSNLGNGDPYVYIHAARVRPGDRWPVVGGPKAPRVVSTGQRNSSRSGGVKSLDLVPIAGYNRGGGQDFPRIAVNPRRNNVTVVWNDASLHPLGDIYLRALPMDLSITGPIAKVNDDNSYTLHFLPAVSVRSDGSTSTSWYDRRLARPDTTWTDYFGEIRPSPGTAAQDFRVTTGSTNWLGTSGGIYPNFGDYTDNASSGTKTYYTWSDGRIGVPQPFVDRR